MSTEVTAVAAKTAAEAIQASSALIEPGDDFIQYSTAGFVTVNLLTASEVAVACRQILPLADGTIVVKNRRGTSRTLTALQGVPLSTRAIELTSITCDCQVYW